MLLFFSNGYLFYLSYYLSFFIHYLYFYTLFFIVFYPLFYVLLNCFFIALFKYCLTHYIFLLYIYN